MFSLDFQQIIVALLKFRATVFFRRHGPQLLTLRHGRSAERTAWTPTCEGLDLKGLWETMSYDPKQLA